MMQSTNVSESKYWITDIFVVSFLLSPFMLCYWRGMWDLLGVYLFPGNDLLNGWTTFAIGCGQMIGYITNPLLSKYLDENRPNKWLSLVLTKLYMSVFGILSMAYWRGVWTLGNYYLLELGWKILFVVYLVIEIALHVLRIKQNVIVLPLGMRVDTKPNVLECTTRFGTKPGLTWRYTFDSIFSVVVAQTLAVLLWQVAFAFMDIAFSSVEYTKSNFICLGIGYCLVLALQVSDPVFLRVTRWIAFRHDSSTPWRRLLALLAWEDFLNFIGFWVLIVFWRGAWGLNSQFVVPDLKVGGWVNTVVGQVGMWLLQVCCYFGVPGCGKDGWMDGTEDRTFQTHYSESMWKFLKQCKASRIDTINHNNSKAVHKSDSTAAVITSLDDGESSTGVVNTAFEYNNNDNTVF